MKNLIYLCDHKIEHMDIKPGNIVVDGNLNTRLIDFGQGVILKASIEKGREHMKQGYSLPYSPPEFFKGNVLQPVRCDVFSFGVMMFEMLFELYPFNMCKTEVLVSHFRDGTYMNLFTFPPERVC